MQLFQIFLMRLHSLFQNSKHYADMEYLGERFLVDFKFKESSFYRLLNSEIISIKILNNQAKKFIHF